MEECYICSAIEKGYFDKHEELNIDFNSANEELVSLTVYKDDDYYICAENKNCDTSWISDKCAMIRMDYCPICGKKINK